MSSSSQPTGTLYVCATPLGHLDDVTPRLLQTLKSVALICAEDTRHTHKLLSRFEIETSYTSVNEHTSPAKIEAMVEKLASGEDLALVTDAGTPGVSDPGPALVRAAAARGFTVSPIPGPCALVAALSISGFDAQRFSFMGFLPRKPGKIRKLFKEVLSRGETVVFYESPFRVAKTIRFLSEVAPEAPVCVCRELTKTFEEILRGSAAELSVSMAARKEWKGEFSVVIGATAVVVDEGGDDEDEVDEE
ncbi:16S rRNA (cytidine(1402)-2'-O)-methyltransferase [bacterium]|nr:MAG: 16S rRNA (cytidine(1402)-2'-O)-methyltransferase [bacterium]